MEKPSLQNEGPGKKLARNFNLNEEQISAMGGMYDIVPGTVFPRLKNKSPDEIKEIMERYAQIIIIETQIMAEALRGENDLLPDMNRQRIEKEIAGSVRKKIVRNPSPAQQHPDNSI